MITAAQFDELAVPLLDLWEEFMLEIVKDIARRLVKTGEITATAAWQSQRLMQSGLTYQGILQALARILPYSEAQLGLLMEKAGVRALAFDDRVYRAVGLNPLPLNMSPAMLDTLLAGIHKTNGVIENLTMTIASTGQQAFVDAADMAYVEVTTGTLDYITAIRRGIKKVAATGLTVIEYPSGHHDQLDVALRRTVITGVGQTTAELQIERADEMGQDLIAVSAHPGARNTGEGPANHESWQGKVYTRKGTPGYQDFVTATGYGTGEGLGGWNCRHSFYPFFEGISKNAYDEEILAGFAAKTVKVNGVEMDLYAATQEQRHIERQIRYWKRQAEALGAAGLDNTEEMAQVHYWQAQARAFVRETKLLRQPEREGPRVLTVRKPSLQ